MKWLKLLWINGLVFLTLIGIVLLTGEIYYRFFYDSTDSFGLTRTTDRWFDRHYQFNQKGIRDNVEYQPWISPGHTRISFIGDSFTAGHGIADVEKRFANLIRRQHPEWEIHVLAGNGLDTGAEIEALEKLPQYHYQFDWVVLVYCLNDIADIVPEWQRIQDRIYEQNINPGFLIQHSYVLNILYYRLEALLDPDISSYYHFVKPAYQGQLWEEQQKRLSSIINFVETHGGKLLVVTFPFLHDIGPDYEFQDVHNKLDRFWKVHGIPHLDLLSCYNKYSPGQLTVNRFDAHPNEYAHLLAAKAIDTFLSDQITTSNKTM